MKKITILILIGFTAFIHADDGVWHPEDRARELMSKSKFPIGDEAEYLIPPEEIWQNLVKDDIKMEGTELLFFTETCFQYTRDGESLCTVDIEFANSEKEAIWGFYVGLAWSSAPDNDLMDSFKVWKEGPGSICIVDSDFEDDAQKYKNGHGELTFIRDGIVVRIDILDNVDCDVAKIAKLIDEQIILTVEKMKNGEVVVQSEEDKKAMESVRADDIKKFNENRIIKLMEELNIPNGDKAQYLIQPKDIWNSVEKDHIKVEGTEIGMDGGILFQYMQNGRPFYTLQIEFADSEKEAILNVCRWLPQSSGRNKNWKEGPGSLCIVDSGAAGEMMSDVPYSRLVFIRDGIIVLYSMFRGS